MTELHVVVRATPDQDPGRPVRERVAAQRAAARRALDEAAAQVGLACPDWPQEEPGGRPLPVDGWCWSISHDDTLVAAAVHTGPVGVDVERIAERRAALHDKVASPQERGLFERWDSHAFTRLWTAKEAVLKAAGVGMAELSLCRLSGLDGDDLLLAHRDGIRRVQQLELGQHLVALHAEGATAVRWDLPR